MSDDKRTLVVPIMLITVGAGWLLTAAEFAPDIDWVWSLALAVIGVVTVVLGGWDKFTAVVAPFFVTASVLSLARQTGKLPFSLEMPILVIAFGVLMLVARSSVIPVPRWFHREPPASESNRAEPVAKSTRAETP